MLSRAQHLSEVQKSGCFTHFSRGTPIEDILSTEHGLEDELTLYDKCT